MSYIYLIECETQSSEIVTKIGVSTAPERRIIQWLDLIQTSYLKFQNLTYNDIYKNPSNQHIEKYNISDIKQHIVKEVDENFKIFELDSCGSAEYLERHLHEYLLINNKRPILYFGNIKECPISISKEFYQLKIDEVVRVMKNTNRLLPVKFKKNTEYYTKYLSRKAKRGL